MSAEQQRLKKIHREAVILAEAKKVLGFPVPNSALSPVAASSLSGTTHADSLRTPEGSAAAKEIYDIYGLTMTAVNAFLLRYLRSKHLSVDEALAKLRRRRVFERTLPTISVTPTTVAALRSGALHLLGNDLEGRPVLYVNMSAFSLPTLELDEAQRLLVILLEFMQARCLLRNNEDHAEARQQRAASGAKPTAPPLTVQDVEKETTRHLQQFTLLINEEGAPWGSHESFLRNSATFFSMFPKYYPLMLGNVLVLGASFEIRMAIKACVGNSPDDVRDAVRMIDRPDLPRYLHAHTIPVELGGQKRVAGSAMNFSEAVLRHWFTLTSQMEEESAFSPSSATSVNATAAGTAAAGGCAGRSGTESEEDRERVAAYQRPLYVPPPPLGTAQRLISRQRQTIELQHLSGTVRAPSVIVGVSPSYTSPAAPSGATSSGGSGGVGGAAAAASGKEGGGQGSFSSPRGTQKVQPGSLGARYRGDEATDDGVCSELSAVDDDGNDGEGGEGHSVGLLEHSGGSPFSNGGGTTTQMFTAASMSMASDGEPEAFHAPHGGGAAKASCGVSADEVAHFAAHPEAAAAALRRERQRREQAEQALQFRDLGVTLDLRKASTIEKELAGLHQDVNVLVAEVLVKAEAAGRRQKVAPTLTQLLDLTLTAFETATNTPATVPAMSLAQPCQREPVSSSCCSFM